MSGRYTEDVESEEHHEGEDVMAKVAVEKIKFHEAANILPLLDGDEKVAFSANVEQNGVLDPITCWFDDKGRKWLIDGRNRYLAAKALIESGKTRPDGQPYDIPEVVFEGTQRQVLAFIRARGLEGRRHLTSGQKAAVTVKANLLDAKYKRAEGIKDGEVAEGNLAEMLAQASGTNRDYIFKCQRLLTYDKGRLLDLVISGELSIPQAMSQMKAETREQKAADEAAGDDVTADEASVLDAEQQLVPDEYRAVFEGRSEFIELVAALRDIRSRVERLHASPAGRWIALDEVTTLLANAGAAVAEAAPHALCPECQGERKVKQPGHKRKTKCKRCDGHGFVNHARFVGLTTAEAEAIHLNGEGEAPAIGTAPPQDATTQDATTQDATQGEAGGDGEEQHPYDAPHDEADIYAEVE
jgi:hypothetical protein